MATSPAWGKEGRQESDRDRMTGNKGALFPSQSPSSLYSLPPLPHLLQGLEQSPLSIEQGADLGSVLQESQLLSSVQSRVPLSSGSIFPRDILLFFKMPN